MKLYYKVRFAFSEECSKAVSRDILIDTLLETDNEIVFDSKDDVYEYLEAIKKTKYITFRKEKMVVGNVTATLDELLMICYNVSLIDFETYDKNQRMLDDFLDDF